MRPRLGSPRDRYHCQCGARKYALSRACFLCQQEEALAVPMSKRSRLPMYVRVFGKEVKV